MRAFVAVDVPAGSAIGKGEREARVPSHLTLLFSADLPEDRVARLVAHLAPPVASIIPFRVTFGPVGAFPSTERPRVVYLPALDGAEGLGKLAEAARSAARAAEVRFDDRPFVPHLTWFRVRGARDQARARQLIGRPVPGGPGPFDVREIALKESTLGPDGAVHRTVARFPLAER